MLCRSKPSPLRRKIRKYIAVLLTVTIAFAVYFEFAVKAQLRDIIIRDMRTVSEEAMNMAVDDFLSEHADAGDRLSDIAFDGGGAVSAITTDPYYINYVKSYITKQAQDYIDELSHGEGVSARLGSFTGLVLLMNVGPPVYFDVDSTQTVSCEFASSFESAGINQTVHHITMTVSVDLLIYNPFRIHETVTTTSTYEIAQTVIVGSVPTYGGVLTY